MAWTTTEKSADGAIPRFQSGRFLVPTQDDSWFPTKTIPRSHTGRFLSPKQENSWFPNRTIFRSQSGRLLVPNQDDSWFTKRTIPRSQARGFLVHKQYDSSFPNRTFLVPKQNDSSSSSRRNFEWPKNREDHSDFDDFLTELIVLTRSTFSKFFASPKKFSRRRLRIFLWPPSRRRSDNATNFPSPCCAEL